MYEQFTDRARKVMQLANQAAQILNHEYIGTEHVLLALLKEGSGVAAQALRNLNLNAEQIRVEVNKIAQPGPEVLAIGKMPHTPRLKHALQIAIEESKGLGHNYVGTEHLLIALMRETEGIAAVVLAGLRQTEHTIRSAVLTALGQRRTAVESNIPAHTEPAPKPTDPDVAAAVQLIQELQEELARCNATIEAGNRKREQYLSMIADYAATNKEQRDLIASLRGEIGRLQIVIDSVHQATSKETK